MPKSIAPKIWWVNEIQNKQRRYYMDDPWVTSFFRQYSLVRT